MPELLPLCDDWHASHPKPASRDTYRRHLRTFLAYCTEHNVKDTKDLDNDLIMKYPPTLLKRYSSSSVNVKIVVLKDFLAFLEDKDLVALKWSRLERQWRRMQKIERRQVLLNEDGIERMIEYSLNTPPQDIIEARNFAFIVFLADTGLRVHEACKLKRGDVDWKNLRGVIIGKGGKQATFHISPRAARLVQRYLSMRAGQDGTQNILLRNLPVFSRHDDGAGKLVKPMTPTTGRDITEQIVGRVLGENPDPDKPITPHRFRHFLIDRARRQGGIMLAKGLARHSRLETTEGYFHLTDEELDRGYQAMFGNPGK